MRNPERQEAWWRFEDGKNGGREEKEEKGEEKGRGRKGERRKTDGRKG